MEDPILRSEFSDLTLTVDSVTGAPKALESRGTRFDLTSTATITHGGAEVRGPMGGLIYPGAENVGLSRKGIARTRSTVDLTSRIFTVDVETTRPDLWRLRWIYRFVEDFPRLRIGAVITAMSEDAIARNLTVDIDISLPPERRWRVHAPGGKLRTNLNLDDLRQGVSISPITGVNGSTGIVALDDPVSQKSLVIWPMSLHTIGDPTIAPSPTGLSFSWPSDVAGQPGVGGALFAHDLTLDIRHCDFASVLKDVPRALASFGITSPNDPPAWGRDANLYEVQIGTSVFHGGYEYSPYPEAKDLLADLDRIQGLGYTALQIMPRHPFPSYNVSNYDDIDDSYGDEETLRAIVEACHRHGMHVILDILLHGVVDGESVATATAAVRASPYFSRMNETVGDITVLDDDEVDPYSIAWGRHLLDFEDHWIAGSPTVHPLRDTHPEWFTRDSAGHITGIYTQAFDTSHPGWQRYFIDSALELVRRLDVDGFRFDAPTYNYFHNWDARTRADASTSMLGCVPLFERLRTELLAYKPDLLLYTEPSGALLRKSMDVNYNYDEQWLLRAVMAGESGRSHWVRNARELDRWLEERDASLPLGSITAHHIDSHDTFWWPSAGGKWRREQVGPQVTAALMCLFALKGEPFMTFVGGEVGIEEEVTRVNRLRLEHPVFAHGRTDYRRVTVGSEHVHAVYLEDGIEGGLVLVNLSDRRQDCTLTLTLVGAGVGTAEQVSVLDQLGDGILELEPVGTAHMAHLEFEPYQSMAFVV